MNLFDRLIKRSFDILLSIFLIIIASPFFIFLIFLGLYFFDLKPLYTQTRIGLHGTKFKVLKFKTMKDSEFKSTVTTLNDCRVTPYGGVLRKYKFDELPQLFNILLGSMSFVGPRPDVPGFADCLKGEDRIILSVRPGITGPASIKYRDEESILALVDNPEKYNKEVIWQDKIEINKKYIKDYSFMKDCIILLKTIRSI